MTALWMTDLRSLGSSVCRVVHTSQGDRTIFWHLEVPTGTHDQHGELGLLPPLLSFEEAPGTPF